MSVATCNPADAVLRRDRRENRDKRTGGSGNLRARAAEQRSGETGDYGRVKATLGTHARGDCKRHRERQSDNADEGACDDVVPDVAAPE